MERAELRSVKKALLWQLVKFAKQEKQPDITSLTVDVWKSLNKDSKIIYHASEGLFDDGIILHPDWENGKGIRFAKGKFASE